MRRKPVVIIIFSLVLFLLAAVLIQINRDILHFTYDKRCQRTFTPGTEYRQDYQIDGPIALKPGSYVLNPELTVQGNGSGIFLIDGDEEEIFYANLPDGTIDPVLPIDVSGHSRQVRIGIRYTPEESNVSVNRVRITADHILYRESIFRHLTISLLLILFAAWLILRLCFPAFLWKLLPAFAKRENELALAFLITLTAASCWPILNGKVYIHGDDMFFHVTRIKGLADSLAAGYFPVRDQLYWLHNYGYGVGFFYPDVFLYFPALLVILGFNLLTAYNIFIVVCSFLSMSSIWYAALRITKNRTAAAAAAVFMAFSAYRLINIYYRAAIGEVQAAIFYPLIILGLYEIFHDHTEKWPIFALGFLGIAGCHLISTAIAVVLTAIFLLIHLKTIIRSRKIIFALLKSVLAVTAIDAFFWLPMLEQSFTNPGLKINQVMSGDVNFNMTNYAFPAQNILSQFKVWDWMWQAGSVYPGWTLLLVPLMGIIVWKKRNGIVKTADFLLLFSIPVLWMCTRSFPWDWKIFLPFVTRIQFAYRFLLPVTVMLSLAGCIYFSAITSKFPMILSMTVLTLFCFFSTAQPILEESAANRTVEKSFFVMQDNRVSGEEYLPSGLHKDYPGKNADTVRLTEADVPLTITAHKRQKLGFNFSFEVPEDSGEVHFSVPLIYYTGFCGTLTAEDGTIFPAEISWDERGLVSISSQETIRGSVSVNYKKTFIQKTGECITMISVCVTGFYLHHQHQKKEGVCSKQNAQ